MHSRVVCTSRLKQCVIACVAISFLTICGCTDLDEITQFAQSSRSVGNAFPGIAEQAEASCTQANTFLTPQMNAALPCDVYPKLNPTLIKVNAALFNYIASLGKLASDDLSKVSNGWDKLSDDLKQADPAISKENQSRASAASGLAKAITNVWASRYREHTLSKIIGENNTAVQDVADFLSDYAADKYLQSIKDEWRYERAYCTNAASAAEPLASDLLARKCEADHFRISRQENAIESYQKALATIKKTHDTLAKDRGHWDAQQLSKDLGPEIVSLINAAVSVNKVF